MKVNGIQVDYIREWGERLSQAITIHCLSGGGQSLPILNGRMILAISFQ